MYLHLEIFEYNLPISITHKSQVLVIRLQLVTITTKDGTDTIIDGPTATTAYNMKQIETADIADNAVTAAKIDDGAITSTKPSESYEKRVTLLDDSGGNALGWTPNGAIAMFTILASAVEGFDSFVSIMFPTENPFHCTPSSIGEGVLSVECDIAPLDGLQLHYMVMNLPGHTNE